MAVVHVQIKGFIDRVHMRPEFDHLVWSALVQVIAGGVETRWESSSFHGGWWRRTSITHEPVAR